MLFEVPLVEILPLIKCKPEAETIVSLKMHLIKLGHFLDASTACDQHRQALNRLREVAATLATPTTSVKGKGQQEEINIDSSRAATLHSILDTTITTIETAGDCSLRNAIKQVLEGLFHIERSLHQYTLQNKSLSQELKYSGYDQLADEKLKLFGVENALCVKLRGVLALSHLHSTETAANLHHQLNKRISRSNLKRPLDSNALTTTTKKDMNIEQNISKTDNNNIRNNNSIFERDDDGTSLPLGQPPLPSYLSASKNQSFSTKGKVGSVDDSVFAPGSGNSHSHSNNSQDSPILESTETDGGDSVDTSSPHHHTHTPEAAAHICNQQQQQQRDGLMGRVMMSHSQSNSINSTPSPEIKINPNNGVFSSHKHIQFRDDTNIFPKDSKSFSITAAAGSSGGAGSSGAGYHSPSLSNGRTHTV